MNKNLWRGLTATFAGLTALLVTLTGTAFDNAGTINSYLGFKTSKIERKGDAVTDTAYYKSDYGDVNKLTQENYDALLKDEYAHAVQEEEEGAVLLRNENHALPLSADEKKVSLFGHATIDPLYKAISGGSFSNDSPHLITYESAMKSAFDVNPALLDAYKAWGGKRGGQIGSFADTSFELGEYDVSKYTSSIKDSFSAYGDAAIVMFARTGGEERDLPVSERDGDGTTVNHLALHKNERDLMAMIKSYKDSGAIKKIIVLLNSGNPLELGWLDEYGVDACLWVGGTGYRGFEGVANILTGKANPSGKLIDTYAASALSAPATVNFGSFEFANASAVVKGCIDAASSVSYTLTYAEGIYVGYRYYETRYEDLALGRYGADSSKGATNGGAWNYADEVIYPFGYGLSYSDFTQEIIDFEVKKEEIEVTVKVTNNSSVAGKSVVELYAQTPYGDYERQNAVEKSAVQLAGFVKTPIIAADKFETVTVTVDKYLLASYDYTNLKGYYLSAGDYYFSIGDDAHDALNNILAAKAADVSLFDQTGKTVSGDKSKTKEWNLKEADTVSYKYSDTKTLVTNQFDDCDLNNLTENGVKYLSRKDWEGTYPVTATEITATDSMIESLNGFTYEIPEDAPDISDFTQQDRSEDSSENIAFVTMRGVDYDDDEIWDEFLNQLSIDEMSYVLIDTGATVSIPIINKPDQLNQDGPDGVSGSVYLYNESKDEVVRTDYGAMCYPNESVLASTWNVELAQKRGYYLGEDCLFCRNAQLWSPGADMHRSPFGGRNFEYYSEDPTVSYILLAATTKEMEKKGVNAAPKHLFGNEQETNRHGVATFMNEQSIREIYLRAFEGAFTKGDASGTMTAYNRIGCTYVGASVALQTNVLRGEWGFKGVIISDMVGSGENYQHTIESLVAGADMFCLAGNNYRAEIVRNRINGQGDGYLLQKLREANKHFYYAFSNSLLANGLDSDSVVVRITPWWQTALIVIDCVVGAATLGFCALSVIRPVKERREQGR